MPFELPIAPMLARAVTKVPTEPGYVHEPKWDGFRCIVSRDGDQIRLGSRSQKELTPYFPEVIAALRDWLPDGVVLDAELVVRAGQPGAERLDWDRLSQRIHPAESRIKLLSEQTPAELVCFDLLAADGTDLTGLRWDERRTRLEALFVRLPANLSVHLSRYTADAETATEWFTRFEGAGLDGVVSKARDGAYLPGKRGWLKVKHKRTAEAVVIGYRVHKRGHGVGSLLLGMYSDEVLVPVGGIGALTDEMRESLIDELEPLVKRDADGQPMPFEKPRSRFSRSTDPMAFELEPELVVEVAFDQLEGHRFRHAVTLVRFRPDRDARSVLLAQVEQAPSYDLAQVLSDQP